MLNKCLNAKAKILVYMIHNTIMMLFPITTPHNNNNSPGHAEKIKVCGATTFTRRNLHTCDTIVFTFRSLNKEIYSRQ